MPCLSYKYRWLSLLFLAYLQGRPAVLAASGKEECFTGIPDEVIVKCEGHDCCTRLTSCEWNATTTSVTICPHSCQGENACDFTGSDGATIFVKTRSCRGDNACQGYGHGGRADSYTIWAHSCHGLQVCQDADASIGDSSCYGYRACANIHTRIDDESCLQSWACLPGVEAIHQLAVIVSRILMVAMAVILILFLHPKPASSNGGGGTALQQEQVVLTRGNSAVS